MLSLHPVLALKRDCSSISNYIYMHMLIYRHHERERKRCVDQTEGFFMFCILGGQKQMCSNALINWVVDDFQFCSS